MFKLFFLCVLCSTYLLISGWVPKAQYLELEEKCYISQQQLGQRQRRVEALSEKFRNLKTERKKCDELMSDFRAKNRLLIDRNVRLLRKIKILEQIISRKRPKDGFELKW